MKKKDYFWLAYYKIKRNKFKSLVVILVISIIFFGGLVSNLIETSLNKYQESLQINVACRQLEIDYNNKQYTEEEIIDKIGTISHANNIEQIINSSYMNLYGNCDEFITEENTGYVEIEGTTNEIIGNELIGEKFHEGILNEVIIPKKIYATWNMEYEIYDTECINGENLVGKNITIRDGEEKYIFKVIGTYDAEKIYNAPNVLYVHNNTIKNIKDSKNQEKSSSVVVTVDKVENIETVWTEIKELGIVWRQLIQTLVDKQIEEEAPIRKNIYTLINRTTMNKIEGIIEVMKIVTYFLSISIIFLISIQKVIEDKKEIGIYRAIGYTNNQILRIKQLEILLLLFLGIILSIFLFIILNGIAEWGINDYINKEVSGITQREIQKMLYNVSQIPKKIDFIKCFYIVGISIIIIGVTTTITIKRILRKEILNSLKYEG